MMRKLAPDPADGNGPSAGIAAAVAALERSDRETLTGRWRSLYRSDPPRGMSRRFLIAAIAHALQAKQAGRTVARVQRRLVRLAAEPSNGSVAPSRSLDAGTRLIREWNGVTHTVDVEAGGYVWNGVRCRSLSAIARAITGTRWSGPRFFGIGDGR